MLLIKSLKRKYKNSIKSLKRKHKKSIKKSLKRKYKTKNDGAGENKKGEYALYKKSNKIVKILEHDVKDDSYTFQIDDKIYSTQSKYLDFNYKPPKLFYDELKTQINKKYPDINNEIKIMDFVQKKWNAIDEEEKKVWINLNEEKIVKKKSMILISKKPRSAYLLFMADNHDKVKLAHPELTPKEITKKLSSMWGNIDQKKYTDMANTDIERYNKDIIRKKKNCNIEDYDTKKYDIENEKPSEILSEKYIKYIDNKINLIEQEVLKNHELINFLSEDSIIFESEYKYYKYDIMFYIKKYIAYINAIRKDTTKQNLASPLFKIIFENGDYEIFECIYNTLMNNELVIKKINEKTGKTLKQLLLEEFFSWGLKPDNDEDDEKKIFDTINNLD
jgi:hypothetical protein